MAAGLGTVAAFVGILSGPVLAAVPLVTGDGLAVELSETGRVAAMRVGATALPLKAAGGFAIADFRDQPESENLVPNPGFEDAANDWVLAPGQSLDTTVTHSGKASVRLEVPGPTPAQSNLGTVVPVKPNTRYLVGLWLRREKVGVCGAYSSERDDANQLTGKVGQTGPSIPAQDGVWHRLAWELTTQPRTTRLSLRADRYLRALAYHKIWRYWHAWGPAGYGDATPAYVQTQFRRGLAYAVFPPVYCISTSGADIEMHRAAFRRYVPAMEELSAAGWEPVPYARPRFPHQGLRRRRRGEGGGHGSILPECASRHIVRTMKARVNLTIDRAVLGQARRVARRQGMSVSGMVEKYLNTLDTPDRPDGQALIRKWAGKLALTPLDGEERRTRLWRKYGLDRPAGEETPPCKS